MKKSLCLPSSLVRFLSFLSLTVCAVAPRATAQPRPSLALQFSSGQPTLSLTGEVGTVYLGITTPVASYAANPWGLYDMIGNVWEWCQDWYGAYPVGSVTDPQGAVAGSIRVIRGGGWGDGAGYCRSAYRLYFSPDAMILAIGFRVVLAPGQP